MNTKQFFALLNQMNAGGTNRTKEDLVSEQTNGRTTSLRDLTPIEGIALINSMKSICNSTSSANRQAISNSSKAFDHEAQVKDRMRKKIIACFRSIGRTVNDAKQWAEKQGKKPFNDYSIKELSSIVTAAQRVKLSHINSVSNKLKQAAQ